MSSSARQMTRPPNARTTYGVGAGAALVILATSLLLIPALDGLNKWVSRVAPVLYNAHACGSRSQPLLYLIGLGLSVAGAVAAGYGLAHVRGLSTATASVVVGLAVVSALGWAAGFLFHGLGWVHCVS